MDKLTLLKTIQDLYVENDLLKQIYNSAQNSIVVTDELGYIIYANDFFLNATGFSSEELIGKDPSQIKSGHHPPEYYHELWQTIKEGKTWHNFFINRKKNGELFYEEATITPIQIEESHKRFYLKIGKLVEREKLASNELSAEMENAKSFIHYLMPDLYQDENLSFQMKFKAYNYLGGDFAVFKKVAEDEYVFGLIDVMGHGVTSSLMGLKVMTIFDTQIKAFNLKETVNLLNKEIVKINRHEQGVIRYVAGVFIHYNAKKRSLHYVNAGHTDLLLRGTETIDRISSNNLILGVSELYDFRINELLLTDSCSLFFYSDGLVECFDQSQGDSDEKLEELLNTLEPSTYRDHFLANMFYSMTNDIIKDDVTWGLIDLNVMKD